MGQRTDGLVRYENTKHGNNGHNTSSSLVPEAAETPTHDFLHAGFLQTSVNIKSQSDLSGSGHRTSASVIGKQTAESPGNISVPSDIINGSHVEYDGKHDPSYKSSSLQNVRSKLIKVLLSNAAGNVIFKRLSRRLRDIRPPADSDGEAVTSLGHFEDTRMTQGAKVTDASSTPSHISQSHLPVRHSTGPRTQNHSVNKTLAQNNVSQDEHHTRLLSEARFATLTSKTSRSSKNFPSQFFPAAGPGVASDDKPDDDDAPLSPFHGKLISIV